MKLIDRNKIDEILRNLWKEDDGHNSKHLICYNKALQEVQCEIDTFEVKEVDLERELETLDIILYDLDGVAVKGATSYLTVEDVKDIAKHFFELGLKANQENNVIGTLEREVKIDAGGYPCIDCYIEFYDYDKDIPLAKEGDKIKIIVVKGE